EAPRLDPFEPVVVDGLRLAGELGHEVGDQLDLAEVVGMPVPSRLGADLRLDPELLAQLARERGLRRLARLDAPAGELPFPRVPASRPPAGEQDHARFQDHAGADGDHASILPKFAPRLVGTVKVLLYWPRCPLPSTTPVEPRWSKAPRKRRA